MKRIQGIILSLSALVLSSPLCFSQTPGEPASRAEGSESRQEQRLRDRINEWWTARQYRGMTKMYNLYESKYRQQVSVEDFRVQSAMRDRFDIVSAKILTIEYEAPTRASVVLEYVTQMPQLGEPVPAKIQEAWIFEDGDWYKVFREPMVPQPPPGFVTGMEQAPVASAPTPGMGKP